MPWVQSLAQSEDYRNPLCAVLYTPWVQQLSQSENCRSSLCAILCAHGSNSLSQSENRATHFVLDCVPRGEIICTWVESFAESGFCNPHCALLCAHRCSHLVNPIMQDAGEQQHIVIVVVI